MRIRGRCRPVLRVSRIAAPAGPYWGAGNVAGRNVASSPMPGGTRDDADSPTRFRLCRRGAFDRLTAAAGPATFETASGVPEDAFLGLQQHIIGAGSRNGRHALRGTAARCGEVTSLS